MRQVTSSLRNLVEARDEQLYVRDPAGLARMIALTTPGVAPGETPNMAAGKAIQHLRVLSRRRSLLAKAFRLMGQRSRALQTVRALRRKVERAA
jgi:hypothetical protein